MEIYLTSHCFSNYRRTSVLICQVLTARQLRYNTSFTTFFFNVPWSCLALKRIEKKIIPTVCYTVYAYMYAIGQNLAFGSCLPHMVKNKIKITALLTRFQSFLGPTRHRCWETSTAAVLQPCLCQAIVPDPGWQTDLPWPKTHPIIAELALWSLGCVWLWLLSLDLIPTLSCSLPRLISDLPYHDKLACVYGSLTTPGCHPQDLCPCLIHTVGLYPLYPVRLLLPAWNNLSGETTCLFCSLTVFITIITYIHIYYFFLGNVTFHS